MITAIVAAENRLLRRRGQGRNGSLNLASGISGATLGHRSPQTVNRYAHVDVGPVRQAVQQTGDALLVAGRVKKPAEVVPLRVSNRRKTAKGNRNV